MAAGAISKVLLSGGTNGRNVKIAATSSPGTTIHTADASAYDEVWLWACNTSSSDVLLTVQLGGTSSPDDDIVLVIPAQSGYFLVVPGLPLTGSVVVKAFAATANVININGYVNRITMS